MQVGYLLERGDRNVTEVTTWVAGTPDWGGTFLGLQIGQLRTDDRLKLAVSTFRCAGCGFLESYAK